jgi:hypothetical protein
MAEIPPHLLVAACRYPKREGGAAASRLAALEILEKTQPVSGLLAFGSA